MLPCDLRGLANVSLIGCVLQYTAPARHVLKAGGQQHDLFSIMIYLSAGLNADFVGLPTASRTYLLHSQLVVSKWPLGGPEKPELMGRSCSMEGAVGSCFAMLDISFLMNNMAFSRPLSFNVDHSETHPQNNRRRTKGEQNKQTYARSLPPFYYVP